MNRKSSPYLVVILGGMVVAAIVAGLVPSLHATQALAASEDGRIDMQSLLDFILGDDANSAGAPTSSAADIVETAAGVYAGGFIADFEGGDPDGFMFDNAGGGFWHVTTGCVSVSPGHTAPGSIGYVRDDTCDYQNAGMTAHSGLSISPQIDLTGKFAPLLLTFKYYLETDGGAGTDAAELFVKDINASTLQLEADNQGAAAVALADGTGVWQTANIDLAAYFDRPVELQFSFKTVDALANNFAGFFVDDILVSGTDPTVTVGPLNPTIPKTGTVMLTATSNVPADGSFTWSSSNNAIASVDSSGLVTGNGAGVAIITATGVSSGQSDSTSVTVHEVTVTPAAPIIPLGGSVVLNGASTNGSDGFTWVSSDLGVATVSPSSGASTTVNGVGGGVATITATGTVSGATDTSTVTVSEVLVLPSSATFNKGDAFSLSATAIGDSAFTWASSNTAVATVSSTGPTTAIVTGVAGGSAVITATGTTSGGTGASSVTVVEVGVTPAATTIQKGANTLLTASSNGDASFTWGSSDPLVAIVDGSGVVTGVGPGTAVITATGNTSGASDSAAVTVVEVVVSPADPSLLIGGTVSLSATSSDGATSFTWSSSVPGVATVNSTGLVTGIGPGTTIVTATSTSTGFSGSVTVTVGAIAVTPSTSFIPVAGTVSLTATSSDPLDASFAWASSNGAVASVNVATGVVTGVSTGTATIVAIGDNSGFAGSATVTVVTVSVTPATAKLAKGSTLPLTASSNDPRDVTFAWSTSDSTVAAVNASGVVTATGPGTATITATGASGATGSATIEVVAIVVTPPTLSMLFGQKVTLSATSTDPADSTFIWSSTNSSVAIVDSMTGLVTAVGQGKAKIFATANITGFSGSADVEVGHVSVSPSAAFVGSLQSIGLMATSTDPLDTFSWSSSNLLVANVNAGTGMVTGTGSGVATITATGTNSGLTGKATITVGIFPGNPVLTSGGIIMLSAKSSQIGESKFLWTSSDPSIASVDLNTGVVVTHAPGTVTITATGVLSGDTMQTVLTVLAAAPGSGGGGGGGGGCFIATAAYGTTMAGEIDALRTVRDEFLLSNVAGSVFADAYYRLSPPLADVLVQHDVLRGAVRCFLVPIVVSAKWATAAPYAVSTVILALASAIALFSRRRRRA